MKQKVSAARPLFAALALCIFLLPIAAFVIGNNSLRAGHHNDIKLRSEKSMSVKSFSTPVAFVGRNLSFHLETQYPGLRRRVWSERHGYTLRVHYDFIDAAGRLNSRMTVSTETAVPKNSLERYALGLDDKLDCWKLTYGIAVPPRNNFERLLRQGKVEHMVAQPGIPD